MYSISSTDSCYGSDNSGKSWVINENLLQEQSGQCLGQRRTAETLLATKYCARDERRNEPSIKKS